MCPLARDVQKTLCGDRASRHEDPNPVSLPRHMQQKE
jgi:hypothetical protein